SVYTPLRVRQPDRPLRALAAGHSVKTFNIDGNNVFEVVEAASQAYELVKQGKGPIFIEATTYRWREHCGVYFDNDIGYRAEEEFLAWKEKCPIAQAEKTLKKEGLLTDESLCQMNKELAAEVQDAVAFAKSSPYLDPSKLPGYVYAK
ncbi:MAG: thiamine pyrophosphate-dependent dehydrogenase E1 component subunit alpha, partial [Deltaproteobacteria bacterium]|nr:thiamine pyrophosphate-dependent dehydrogenase E1 component subunit alpha [Deltaproteobacteria bacterium]